MKVFLLTCTAFLSAGANSICIGNVTTDFGCVVPILDNDSNLVGSGILIAKNKVITAAHVSGLRTKVGNGPTERASQRVAAPAGVGGFAADLAVLCFDHDISNDFYTIDPGTATIGSTICLVGYGPSSVGSSSPYTLVGDANPTRREGKNKVDSTTTLESNEGDQKYRDNVYCFDFDPPGSSLPNDSITTPNDSGGAVFVIDSDGSKRLVGLIVGGDADETAAYGMNSYASKLNEQRDWIATVPEPFTFATLTSGMILVRCRRRTR